jgi:transcription termination/antitermination protein NusA
VQWSGEPVNYAINALNPAKISRVFIVDNTEPDRLLEVVVEESQLSLAIGKKGQNVRLASKLIGWNIDIKSDEEKKREVENEMRRLAISSQSVQTLPHVSAGVLTKLEEAGVNTIGQLMDLTEDELMEIPGIAEKTAAKVIDAVEEVMSPILEAEAAAVEEAATESVNGAGRRRPFLNAKDEASAKLDEITGATRTAPDAGDADVPQADRASEVAEAADLAGKSADSSD